MDPYNVQQLLQSLTLTGDKLPIGDIRVKEMVDGTLECMQV